MHREIVTHVGWFPVILVYYLGHRLTYGLYSHHVGMVTSHCLCDIRINLTFVLKIIVTRLMLANSVFFK